MRWYNHSEIVTNYSLQFSAPSPFPHSVEKNRENSSLSRKCDFCSRFPSVSTTGKLVTDFSQCSRKLKLHNQSCIRKVEFITKLLEKKPRASRSTNNIWCACLLMCNKTQKAFKEIKRAAASSRSPNNKESLTMRNAAVTSHQMSPQWVGSTNTILTSLSRLLTFTANRKKNNNSRAMIIPEQKQN